jgi:hypothetical protein
MIGATPSSVNTPLLVARSGWPGACWQLIAVWSGEEGVTDVTGGRGADPLTAERRLSRVNAHADGKLQLGRPRMKLERAAETAALTAAVGSANPPKTSSALQSTSTPPASAMAAISPIEGALASAAIEGSPNEE